MSVIMNVKRPIKVVSEKSHKQRSISRRLLLTHCFIVLIHSFIHFRYLYSAFSRFLLRGAPDYSADTESEFHAEAHEHLRVKDLPRIPTRWLEVDSNPQPSGCKAPKTPIEVD